MIIHFWLRVTVSQNSNKLGKNESGKLIRLIEMLEEILDSQEKVIIFTQFVAMGNLLQKELESYFKEEIPFISGKVIGSIGNKLYKNFNPRLITKRIIVMRRYNLWNQHPSITIIKTCQ